MTMFDAIRGKRVLITGSGSGIGACMAELFAAHGAVVGVHYHSSGEKAKEVEARIRKRGGEATLLQADLLDPEACAGLVPRFIAETGGIDVLVNNAGGVLGHPHFLEMDRASWEQTLALDLTAPFFLAQAAFAHMKDHGGGRIISISSIAAKYGGSPRTTHYGAAKAGVEAFTKTLAKAGAGHGILVNAVQPGVIDTGFHRKIGRASLADRAKQIPLGRPGTPLDVARLCLFLASEGGDYITGQVLGVTGGD
jgi:3-oxoacyl-[acyl-carrier protein] reductase